MSAPGTHPGVQVQLDDGLPFDAAKRDEAVADVCRTHPDAALQQPNIAALMCFGLSLLHVAARRHPCDDGAPRRPLPFDDGMQPKPTFPGGRHVVEWSPHRTTALQPTTERS